MAKKEEPIEVCMDSYDYIFKNDILKDKVAFITGGGSGICFTIAEVFMRHGCHTVILGRKMDRLQLSAQTLSRTTGCRCLPVQMDVRQISELRENGLKEMPWPSILVRSHFQPKMVMEAVDAALKEFGRIDYVINGAAGNFLCPIERLSFNAFKTVMEIDTMGTFNVSKAVFEKYMKAHGGVIINITATLHFRGTTLQAHVGAAKAAIEAMTRHMAVEWGPNGIRVMCVAPGPIADTEGMRRLGGHLLKAGPIKDMFLSEIPIQRMGIRSDIGDVCLSLVTRVGELLTGTTIVADGGSWLTEGNTMGRLKAHM